MYYKKKKNNSFKYLADSRAALSEIAIDICREPTSGKLFGNEKIS